MWIPSRAEKKLHQDTQLLAGHQHHQSINLCKSSPVCCLWLVPACDRKAPAQLDVCQREACSASSASHSITACPHGTPFCVYTSQGNARWVASLEKDLRVAHQTTHVAMACTRGVM